MGEDGPRAPKIRVRAPPGDGADAAWLLVSPGTVPQPVAGE